MNRIRQLLQKDNSSGVAAIVIVMFVGAVMGNIAISIASTNLNVFESIEYIRQSRRSFYLAESGVEDSILQLEDDLAFSGNPAGEIIPTGTYFSDISNLGSTYTVSTSARRGDTLRSHEATLVIEFSTAPVATKASYMADFFYLGSDNATVRGDVWTNDDFDINEGGVIEGNLTSLGKGSFAVNWVWDGIIGGNPSVPGGRVIDNPETSEVEGNVFAEDTIRVSGPTALVTGDAISNNNVFEIFGGTIEGSITQNAGLEYDDIPVPTFDYEFYEQLAITNGTYFSNGNAFENYVDSFDDGDTRTLPDGVYYVKSGAVQFEGGSDIHLNGTLIAEGNIDIRSGWFQVAQNDLPAIVGGQEVQISNKFNFFGGYQFAGPVRITGIVFSEKDVDVFRTFPGEDIIVDGGVWSGDDIFIRDNSFIKYNPDVLEVDGFGFATGISGITKLDWEEVY